MTTTYEAETADLAAVATQLVMQADISSRTNQLAAEAATTMMSAIEGAAGAAELGVAGLLGELTSLTSMATVAVTDADWIGPDGDRFRTATADLTAVIFKAEERLGIAFGNHQASVDQVKQTLVEALGTFGSMTQTSGRLSARLAEALRVEVRQYEHAFAQGFGGVSANVGVGAEATVSIPTEGGWLDRFTEPLASARDRVEAGARKVVEEAIRVGDNLPRFGKDRVNSEFENRFLQHWLAGSGETLVLSGDELNLVRASPIVTTVGAAIQAGAPAFNGRGEAIDVTAVYLENGQPGYRAAIDFYDPLPAGQSNPLDGSLGGAAVYYDANGVLVGVSDRYDFTNNNIQVDATNAAGGLVGAKGFEVRGGVIGN